MLWKANDRAYCQYSRSKRRKHLPVVDIKNGKVNVTVGVVAHPMVPEHFIEWLYLETEKGGQLRKLVAGEAPEAIFSLNGEKAIAVYAYCNLHGLWKTEIVEEAICDLQPVDHDTTENYIVCNCNQVSYFTILDEVQKHGNIEQLLDVFEQVKDTTHCSTGCGGCYDKVIEIISEAMSGGKK